MKIAEPMRSLQTELDERLANWFFDHQPAPEQMPAIEELRDAGKLFAEMILRLAPASADRTVALIKVREAVLFARAAITYGGK
jgi:hypothetical protein